MAPHAEGPTTNGTSPADSPSSPTSKTINHLKSYPIVADSINTFSSTPLGQRTISLSTSAYSTFIAPLSPYLSAAYPYVSRADDLADSSLSTVDSRFPIVKESTENLKSMVVDTVGYPRRVVAEVIVRGQHFADEKKEYVFKVYADEQEKIEGEGVVGKAKAGVTTGFVVSSELMSAIANYLGTKKETAKDKKDGLKAQAKQQTNQTSY